MIVAEPEMLENIIINIIMILLSVWLLFHLLTFVITLIILSIDSEKYLVILNGVFIVGRFQKGRRLE